MNKQEIFAAWAPDDGPWSPWVKPVLFSQIEAAGARNVGCGRCEDRRGFCERSGPIDGGGRRSDWRAKGSRWGCVWLRSDISRVPLYNACPSPVGEAAIVEVRPIIAALEVGTSQLSAIELGRDARPALLLDAKRNPAVRPDAGQFDNRSISLPTDFPSANLLLSRGIRRHSVGSNRFREPAADLAHTLRRWQDAGMEIFAVAIEKSELTPQRINVARPKTYRALWHNLLAKVGLRPSPLGGFGGVLPDAVGGVIEDIRCRVRSLTSENRQTG